MHYCLLFRAIALKPVIDLKESTQRTILWYYCDKTPKDAIFNTKKLETPLFAAHLLCKHFMSLTPDIK